MVQQNQKQINVYFIPINTTNHSFSCTGSRPSTSNNLLLPRVNQFLFREMFPYIRPKSVIFNAESLA